MHRHPSSEPARTARIVRAAAPIVLAVLLTSALGASAAHAAKHAPFAAKAGLATAESAALVWATDAALVYVENDEDVDAAGNAPRWGYLFYSATRQKARAYSIRSGRIVVAEDLDMTFAAPPLSPQWIDGEAALRAADAHGGRAFCRDHAGRASTLLLARGTIQPGEPDRTTWTIVYTSPSAPSLFVVVDAERGQVCRTWRG
jgi:hypothetical protein